jgi:geranylgeranyl diphosphate synthase type I
VTVSPAPVAPASLVDASSAVDAAMERFMEGRTLPLYRMMGYHLGWVDENGEPLSTRRPMRLRGAMSLLAARALRETGASAGGTDDAEARDSAADSQADSPAAVRHAAAVELVHNYSQMHADVQEGNTERAGRPSVWWTWGPAQAINAGDGMHALARLAVFGLREQGVAPAHVSAALRVLDEATLRLCEGSYYDTVYQERLSVAVDDYMTMVGAFSGALMGCALRLGGMAAEERDPDRLAALENFGSKVGAAIRIAGDHAAFWPAGEREGPVQGRLLAKKKSLPVVHALQEGEPKQKRALGEMYAQRVLDPGDVGKIAAILEDAGSKSYTETVLTRLRDESETALAAVGLAPARAQELREAAGYARDGGA